VALPASLYVGTSQRRARIGYGIAMVATVASNGPKRKP